MSASGVRLNFAPRPDFARGVPGIDAGPVGARCEEQPAMSVLPVVALLWLAPCAPPQVPAAADVPKLDLNSATQDQLMALPGVGPKRAEAIVKRRQRRPYRRIRDLRAVKGIGPKRFRQLKGLVMVQRPARQSPSPPRRRAQSRTRAPRCWPRPPRLAPGSDQRICVRPHQGGFNPGP